MSMVKELSFYDLIEKNIIEVPIIQREYAQGRQIPKIKDIRQDFVEDLITHIKENKKLHLGFVYGRTDGDTKRIQQKNREVIENILGSVKSYANQFDFELKTVLKSPESKENSELKFIPLDGQQRLTTLYLLFWLIYIKSDSNDKVEWIDNFYYINRKSAMDFSQAISNYENISEIRKHFELEKGKKISAILDDMKFFLFKWKNDSTVRGMLVMLDDLESKCHELEINFNEINLKELPIFFDYLDLNELDQSDELYVKMNARGKQLTDFEHFKAWLQEQSKESVIKDQEKEWLQQFWVKIDTEWLNLFWKEFDDDFSKLDDYYYNFIKHLALLFNSNNRNLYSKIRNTSVDHIEYISLKNFKLTNGELFFNIDCLKFIEKVFTFLLDDDKKISYNNLLADIYCPPFTDSKYKLTDKFLKKGDFNLSLWDLVYYYSFLIYVTNERVVGNQEFKSYMRLTRNLIYNSQIQNPESFYNAINQLNYINNFNGLKIYDKILDDNFKNKSFDDNQFLEEQVKVALLEDVDFYETILSLENHEYFYGQIRFLLDFSKNSDGTYDLNQFKLYGKKASILFSDAIRNHIENIPQYLIQRSLLTYGDYFPENKSNHKFCLNESGTLRTKNENWRLLFDDVIKRNNLKLLLNDIKVVTPAGIIKFMKERIFNFLTSNNDKRWEFFFIKHPEIFQYCDDGAIRWFNKDNIRLLKGTTMVGYHNELRSYAFYIEHRPVSMDEIKTESPVSFHPFKSFYNFEDKNTAGHPGFKIYDCFFGENKYQVNARYSLNSENNYEIKIFQDDEVQKAYDYELIQILNDFSFKECPKDDKVYYCLNVSADEVKKILDQLCAQLLIVKNNAND